MTPDQPFPQLLRDLATKAGIPTTQPISEEGQVLTVDPDLEIAISYASDRENIILSSVLCELNQPVPANVYRSLLEANFFWFETDGATLSLDGVSNRVVVIDQRPLALIDTDHLIDWLDQFSATAQKWKTAINNRNMESEKLTSENTEFKILA